MAMAWSVATRAAGWLGLSAALVACGNSTTEATGAGGSGGSDGSGGSGNGTSSGGMGAGGEGGTSTGMGGEAGGPSSPLDFEGPLPEFSLEDVNASSSTTGQSVNPRDYLGQVSAWYFAHAT